MQRICLVTGLLPVLLFALFSQHQNALAQDAPNALLRRPSLIVPQATSRTPLFWADGIMSSEHLPMYQQAGFNTVVVRLFWQPTEDGSIVASDLEPQQKFARDAAAIGIKIIYSLPPAPFGQENNFRMSGQAGPYRLMWANWAQRAIAQLRNTPGLVGWMLPDDPRSLSFANDAGWARWIAANYSSVEVLNRQWQTKFASLDEATLEATRRLIARWRGPGKLTNANTDAQIRDYIEMASKRPTNQNFAFHPASLALANYQWDAYRALLDFWAQTARGADPTRVIFSGRLPDYAQLLSLPPSIDVSMPFLSPGLAEQDLATHNSQAVDIARRGGRFLVAPMLSTHINGLAPEVPARLMAAWADAALAHGSIGLAFDSWNDLLQNKPLRHAIIATLARLQNAEYSALWGQAPASTSAIVLTPLADGVTLKPIQNNSQMAIVPAGEAGSTPAPRGLYGFGEEMIEGEPNSLVAAMRWGSAFGSTDFLSSDELTNAYSLSRGGALKNYSVVFLPQALSVSPEMAQELANYVAGGGVIVTDLGLGASQAGGQADTLSPEMASMLGISLTKLQTVAFNLVPGEIHPLMPTWSTQATMRAQTLTQGNGPQGAAFAGPVAFGELMPGTVPLALAFQMPERSPGKDPKDPSDDVVRIQRSWLTLRPYGNGFAVFAPFRLWSSWHSGQPGFDGFHGDLLARKATLSHVGIQSLTSQPVGVPEGVTNFVEAINYPNAIALINHNAASETPYGTPIFDSEIPPKTALAMPGGNDDAGDFFNEMPIQPLPDEDPENAPLPDLIPVPTPTPAPSTAPSQPAIIQTAGAEYFLWSEAICVFPTGATLTPTPGRVAPVEGVQDEFMLGNIVRPPLYHPLILHAFVPSLEMRVLRALPIRAQNMQGGPLAARVAEYNAKQIALRVWPNSESALPVNNTWRVALGKTGVVRVSIFDKEDGYRTIPGSRHFIAVTENSGERGAVRATANYIVDADAQGKLVFELTGTLLGVFVRPARDNETIGTPQKPDPDLPPADVRFPILRPSAELKGRDVNPGSADFHKKYN